MKSFLLLLFLGSVCWAWLTMPTKEEITEIKDFVSKRSGEVITQWPRAELQIVTLKPDGRITLDFQKDLQSDRTHRLVIESAFPYDAYFRSDVTRPRREMRGLHWPRSDADSRPADRPQIGVLDAFSALRDELLELHSNTLRDSRDTLEDESQEWMWSFMRMVNFETRDSSISAGQLYIFAIPPYKNHWQEHYFFVGLNYGHIHSSVPLGEGSIKGLPALSPMGSEG